MGKHDISADVLERARIRLAALKHYLAHYESVFGAFEDSGELQVLVQVENTLLERMLMRNQSATDAAKDLIADMSAERSKEIVKAILVDVLLNDRIPGERVVRMPTRSETYARL